jgi:hypothetical protein
MELKDYFIRINNRKNFLISDVPSLHPQSLAYLDYWKTQKKRCVEGFWSVDDADVTIDVDKELSAEDMKHKGKWRYMPSNLYFYVNFGTILHQPEDGPKSAPKKRMRPSLRDVEWEFFYHWIECRGFSGFSDDDKVTCDREVLDYQKGKIKKEDLDKHCINQKGEVKEYVPAREYLKKLHDKPLGYALYNNQARNLFMLGARGFGKSYMVGVGVVLHELLFDGAKVYNKDSIVNPYKVEIFVGAALSSKSADILSKTRDALENLKGDWGGDAKVYTPPPFSKKMAGSLEPNNMKNPWRHEYEKKVGGQWKKFGTGSNVKHGIYTIENPEAAAGTRPGVMVVEEVGLLPNVLTVHGSNTACQMEGVWKFGSTVYLGTGGNVDKIQESEIIFRDPKGFEFIEFDDIWEGSGKLGWFVPAIYAAMNQLKDENGNTKYEKAMAYHEEIRVSKRKSKDASALALQMMNYPLIPSEMFLNAKGAMFPQAELKAHLANMTAKPHEFENTHYHGELIWNNDGNLQWQQTSASKLERQHPIDNNKGRPGVIEIVEMPKTSMSGQVHTNRYLQGTDTYDDDESSTNSLGSTFVMDSWTGRIVAEYTGRRGTKEFYEICRKLNIFYKTTHNYEQNKKGLYTYYDQKNSTHLLCDTPESLRDVADITISKVGNKRKGTTASKPVVAYGLRLILDWLLEPAYGKDNPEILNLHTLHFEGLVRELMNYNSDGNFDRVSALVMLMILKEERIKYIDKQQRDKVKSLAEDDFFSRNYTNNTSKFA